MNLEVNNLTLLFLVVQSLELIPPRTPSDRHLLNLGISVENNFVQLILAEVNHFSSICPGVTSRYSLDGRFFSLCSVCEHAHFIGMPHYIYICESRFDTLAFQQT